MTWRGRKTLVTGAGGFIGSHLCERLVHDGAEVTAFVRYTSQGRAGLLDMLAREARSAIQVRSGDLRDSEAVRGAVAGQAVVFHLGALIAIPYSYVHPVEVTEVNVIGTLNVLNAAREADVERVVHTSTSEVYGTAVTVPMSEEHRLHAQSPYAASKVGADALAHAFHCSFEVPVSTVRPFNTYGPRQSGRAVIPTIVGQALYGDSIRLGSLNPRRDFTFVTDIVAGFLAIASSDQTVGQVLSIGSGRDVSIGDLVDRVMDLTGRSVAILSETERQRPAASEVLRLICDPSRARSLTGWQPRVGLDEGLGQVIEFMKAHPHWTRTSEYEV